MPAHSSIHDFTFFFAPCVPHIVEEAGDRIFRMVFHDFSVSGSTFSPPSNSLYTTSCVSCSQSWFLVSCSSGRCHSTSSPLSCTSAKSVRLFSVTRSPVTTLSYGSPFLLTHITLTGSYPS